MFSKKIKPMCLYCLHADDGPVDLQMCCPRKGIVTFDYHCRKYIYDPTKRIPKRPSHSKSANETLEVFSL